MADDEPIARRTRSQTAAARSANAEIAARNYNSVSTTYYRQYSSSASGTDFGLSRSNLASLFSN